MSRDSDARERRNGHDPHDDTPPSIDELPIRHVIADTARQVSLTWNRLDAFVKDSAAWRARTEARLSQRDQLSEVDRQRTNRIEAGVLELVGRAHRQDAEIARVRASIPTARGSTPESEFMTEAARQGLALAKLDREEAIAARRRRNAALIKVAIGAGFALIAAGSSVVTYLLSR